jgi:hypothetical protein
VAVELVHLLELVEVQDHQRDGVALAAAALDLAMEGVVHGGMVEAACEGVRARRQREHGVRARVAAGRGGQVAKRLEQRELVARHALLALVGHGKDALQPAVPAQRDRERAVPAHRLVALHDPSDQALADVHRLADPLRGPAVGGPGADALGSAPEEDAGVVGVEQPGRLLADAHEHPAGVEALVQAAHCIQEARRAVHHGYSPRVLAMMFFWISEVPP